MFAKFFADVLTKPKPQNSPVLKTPAEFGLDYEDVAFKASDGVTLSGWLVKGGTEKVVVFSHFGSMSSRSGYTPKGKGLIKPYKKDIEYLQMAKYLVNAGYSILMYDFRNHGNSEKGICSWVTGGVEEYKDVIAAVEFLSTHEKYKDAHIGLISYCMGCNSTTYAYGHEGGLQNYPNIKAFIAVQPVANMDFLKAYGLPGFMVRKANQINLERGGKDFTSSCVPYAAKITVPTLLVQAKHDPWTNLDSVKEYYDRIQVEKEMFWIEDIKERLATYDYFNHSPEKMLAFFGKYL